MSTRTDGLRATSTSTVVVDAVGTRLRMFGIAPDFLTQAGFGTVPAIGVPSSIDATYVTGWHGYVESDESFEFYFDAWPLISTAIPSHKEGQPLDDGAGGGARLSSVEYQDPFVLRLPNDLGWLMLLSRYHNPDQKIGPGGVRITPDTTIASIVAFWSRDASFATGFEQGPFQLVSRSHHTSAGDLFGSIERYWLGVPGAAVQVVDGIEWLYVYYVVEPTTFTNGGPGAWDVRGLASAPQAPEAAVSGIWVRRIKVGDLALVMGQASVDGSWIDEAAWDGDEAGLLPGEALGKTRIWVPTGSIFTSGGRPAKDDQGNTEFEAHFPALTLADPAAVVVEDGTLKLYFAAIGLASIPPEGAGIWLACAVPASATPAFGVDFVVRTGGLLPGSSLSSWQLASPADGTYLLDPDPVKLPTGDWVVYFGVPQPGVDPAFLPTDAVVGPAWAGEPDWERAWS